MDQAQLPYWRLSSFYFWYYFAFGVWMPYSALYFSDKGFSPEQIGILVGMTSVTRIIAPNLWGWLADKTQRRMLIVRTGILSATTIFTGIFLPHSMMSMLVVIIGFTFFLNSVMSQFDVMTLRHLGESFRGYGKIRAWGSFGFVVAVVVSGAILDGFGVKAVPAVVLLALVIAAIIPWTLYSPPGETNEEKLSSTSLKSTLLKPAVLALLFAGFMLQVSHAPYYTFFSIYMQSLGYEKLSIGMLWGLAVSAEVLLLSKMHVLLERFDLKFLLLLGLVGASLRWILTALFAQQLVLLIAIQCMHAISFAVFHSASVEFVRRTFSYRAQGSGQAILNASSYGAGAAVGSLLVGMVWVDIGIVSFYWAAIASLLGAAVLWYYVPLEKGEG